MTREELGIFKGAKESWSEFCKRVILAMLENGAKIDGADGIGATIPMGPDTIRGWLTRDASVKIKDHHCGLVIMALAPWQIERIPAADKIDLGLTPRPPAKTAGELEIEKSIATLKANGYYISK